MRRRHVSGAAGVVRVPTAGTVAVAMVFTVVAAVAGVLAVAVKGGEVLAEGLAVTCVRHVGSVRESGVVEDGSSVSFAEPGSPDIRAAPWLSAGVSRRRERD
jgi:hypothetical protein